MSNVDEGTYFGLSDIELGCERLEYPRGIILSKTYAHITRPAVLAFSRTQSGQPDPEHWRYAHESKSEEVTCQLFIPYSAAPELSGRIELAQQILFVLRVWADPRVMLTAGSNIPFDSIASAEDGHATLIEFPARTKHFHLLPASDDGAKRGMRGVAAILESALELFSTSPEFRLAAAALNSGQFHEESSLTIVSIWGALEAIFAPGTGELRFRVSALIAAYLHPPGRERHEEQKRIAKLYDKRSAAAHGRARHTEKDLFDTLVLMRTILVDFIRSKHVPRYAELEAQLFGYDISAG